MSGSNRVWACDLWIGPGSGFKMRALLQLCVGLYSKGQQGEIEGIRPSPTNSKNRLKQFCEVGYANFRPNVLAACKRISTKLLVGVRLHA